MGRLIACDICGEILEEEKKKRMRQLNIPIFDTYFSNCGLGEWFKNEYIICDRCFENMKHYCKANKGARK